MDNILKKLSSNDDNEVYTALQDLTQEISNKFDFPELNVHEHRANLWKALYDLLIDENRKFHKQCLQIVRILSRDKKDINELVTKDYLDMLLSDAGLVNEKDVLDLKNQEITMEALMCLCNITFNATVPRALCCKNGTLEGIFNRLHQQRDVPIDMKYFDLKILFIITALCSEIRIKIKDEMHGLTYLIEALESLLQELKQNNHNADVTGETHKLPNIHVNFAIEILKTLFNLTMRPKTPQIIDEEEEQHYTKLTDILHDFLLVEAEDSSKKIELDGHVINLLLNMPNECISHLVKPIQNGDVIPPNMQYEDKNMMAIHEVLEFLKSRFAPEPSVTNQYELLSPVLSAITKFVKCDRVIRKYLRIQILPPLRDIHTRPEQGNTIRNCLCRLLTSPITQVCELAADFLFVLCKENVGRMIKYTGYGNAAGMFATRGLLSGRNGDTDKYSSDSENSDTEEYNEFKHGINPVVGCYQEPRPSPTANMTDEQKEYEAMKLVELMDNLTKKGIVRPCRIGADGKPEPIDHVLQLQQGLGYNESDESD